LFFNQQKKALFYSTPYAPPYTKMELSLQNQTSNHIEVPEMYGIHFDGKTVNVTHLECDLRCQVEYRFRVSYQKEEKEYYCSNYTSAVCTENIFDSFQIVEKHQDGTLRSVFSIHYLNLGSEEDPFEMNIRLPDSAYRCHFKLTRDEYFVPKIELTFSLVDGIKEIKQTYDMGSFTLSRTV